MALEDEEDNDLYGESAKKKGKRVPCSSCGDTTSFANATGNRERLGLCTGCFSLYRISKDGRAELKSEDHPRSLNKADRYRGDGRGPL